MLRDEGSHADPTHARVAVPWPRPFHGASILKRHESEGVSKTCVHTAPAKKKCTQSLISRGRFFRLFQQRFQARAEKRALGLKLG